MFDRDRDRDRDRHLGRDSRDRQRSQDNNQPYRNGNGNGNANRGVRMSVERGSGDRGGGDRGGGDRGSRDRDSRDSDRGSRDRGGDRGDRGIDRGDSKQPAFARAVEIEMENLLKQMYADMNATQTIPLEQLAVANPDLYAQMRTAAESTVHAYDRDRGDRGGGGSGGGAGRGGESSGWRADAASGADESSERKISLRSATGLGVKLAGKGGVTEGKRGSGPFVNAFIAEAPVVVDISRAEALLKQLLDTEIKTASLADAESIFTGEMNRTEENNHPLYHLMLCLFILIFYIPHPLAKYLQ
jgi:hypothetical protein